MAGADDDNTVWATQFADLLAKRAAAVVELSSLISTQAQEQHTGDDEPWVRSAERLEALWRHFLQEQSEAFVEAWPDFVRNLTSLLPLVSRGQPLIGLLAQIVPLLAGPELLGRAVESKGESLVRWLEQFLADLHRSQKPEADPACAADEQGTDAAAVDSRGPQADSSVAAIGGSRSIGQMH